MQEILKFEKDIHNTIWGYESWEISAHHTGPSKIEGGEGATLDAVMPGFPLLMKVIQANSRLSVQVHPNERTASVTGGEPKTEMWCILEDGPIYAGLKPGTDPMAIAEAVSSGKFEELLVRHDAKAGEVYFIPGGLVHAIGDGVKLYEVQQSSNTTYRLYDWGRVGADGKPRQLHITQSLQAIDYALPVPEPKAAVKCDYFDFSQLALEGEAEIPCEEGGFIALYAAKGAFKVNGIEVAEGQSALVNPGTSAKLEGEAKVFVTKAAL